MMNIRAKFAACCGRTEVVSADTGGGISPSGRLLSIDVLRGFNMAWIVGLTGVVLETVGLFSATADRFIGEQFSHVDWNGLHFIDTVYPMFLFITGLSFPFSYAGQRARGVPTSRICLRLFRRAVTLVALGILYNGFLEFKDIAHFRYASVLGRIGVSWFLGALLYVFAKPRYRIVTLVLMLVGYWAILANCVSPLAPAGASSWSLEGCFPGYLDTLLTPGSFWEKGIFEPSGVPMAVFSVPTVLLGMLAGDILRQPGETGFGRTNRLLVVGAALAVLGLACAAAGCPVNKKLWTPSFMLVNGAIDFILLAVFHWTIDVKGFRAWAMPLTVIGSNAIAAYLLWRVVNFGLIGGFFANGLDRVLGTRSLFLAYCSFGALWLVLWFLKRKGVFFKV